MAVAAEEEAETEAETAAETEEGEMVEAACKS